MMTKRKDSGRARARGSAKPKEFTAEEYLANPAPAHQEAKEHGAAVILGRDGKPHMTISILQEDLPLKID